MAAILSLLVIGCAAACTVVDSDRILGKDLGRANAQLAALPPELFAGFAPSVGMSRLFSSGQLKTIGRQNGIPVENIDPVCFERRGELLTPERLQPVLDRIAGPDVRVEIVDFSRYPVPDGELEFSSADLMRPGGIGVDGIAMWRGHIKDGARNTATIWVRVRVNQFERWLETTGPVAAKQVFDAGMVTAKSGWRVPFARPPLKELDAVIGNRTSRSLSAGQVLLPAMVTLANEIERGDPVDVEVASGAISLRFKGRAETAGRRDDFIFVSTNSPAKRWRGRVQRKGRVRIDADEAKSALAVRGRGGSRAGDADDSGGQAEEGSAGRTGLAAGSISR